MKRTLSSLLGLLLAGLLVGCQSPVPSGQATAQPDRVSLAVDPADGSLLKASAGLFRSTDQGQTWQPLSLPASSQSQRFRHVAISRTPQPVVVAGGPGAGILRSDDSGRTWKSISGALPSQEVAALAIHSFRPDTVYAWIPGQGVFQTENAGDRWQKMDDGPAAPVLGLVHSPLEGSMNTGWLYAATAEGAYLTMDCF